MSLGTDVLALDILRGRDHGLDSYTKYLEICTKTRIQSWSDLRSYINDEVSCSIKINLNHNINQLLSYTAGEKERHLIELIEL